MEARVESRTYIRQTTSFCDIFFFNFVYQKMYKKRQPIRCVKKTEAEQRPDAITWIHIDCYSY